jgi:phosphatidylglycerophosphatase C
VRGTPRVLVAAVRAIPQVRDRDAYKLTLIAQLFRGEREDRLAALGEAYVASLEAGLRPELLDRLRWHQAEGHATVLVSASLGAYLRPLAERLGLDAALAVELVVGADGRLTGEVVGGLNTRGPEKVSRLRAWVAQRYGPDADVELWAYGDSSGDEQLLALADHPTWVGKRATRAGAPPAGDGG